MKVSNHADFGFLFLFFVNFFQRFTQAICDIVLLFVKKNNKNFVFCVSCSYCKNVTFSYTQAICDIMFFNFFSKETTFFVFFSVIYLSIKQTFLFHRWLHDVWFFEKKTLFLTFFVASRHRDFSNLPRGSLNKHELERLFK